MLSSSEVHFRKRSRRFNILCANTTRGLHITRERFTFEYLNKKHVFFTEGQNPSNFKMSKSIEISTLIIILK